MQYKAANRAITSWEHEIRDIGLACLDTKRFASTGIKTNFYMISGTKPYKQGSPRNVEIKDMAIPQLQWTAMCCRMKIGTTHDITLSGGYIGSNRKPDYQQSDEDLDQNLFPVFPPFGKEEV